LSPASDPALTEERYERSWAQNERLGLNAPRTELLSGLDKRTENAVKRQTLLCPPEIFATDLTEVVISEDLQEQASEVTSMH
jgi:hypothetical protein